MTRRAARPLIVPLLYALLTCAFTFPLVLNLMTHVLGDARLDNYEYVWKLWWVQHAVFDLGVTPWFNERIYYPFGYPLAYGEMTPIHTFLLMPVTRVLGAVVTYNLAMIGSTILTGWATYALARRWLARLINDIDPRLLSIAAFYAGAAFTFSASRLLKLTGHLPLVDTHWLVLALLCFDAWLEERRLRLAVLSALMISFSALSSWYYALMLGLLLPVYALARGGLPSLLRARRTYAALGVTALITGGLCLPFLVPYLHVAQEGAATVPLGDAAFWAASPTDYLMPNAFHPLWGEAARRVMWHFPSPMITEFVIPIGWVTLLFGTWALRHTRGDRWRALKWTMFVAFVLSLGPYLHVGRLPLGIPLPVLLLREWLPFADGIRTWGRFSTFVMLGFSLLAAAGIVLALKDQRRRVLAGTVVVGLMLFGAWRGGMPIIRVEARPVDSWLAAQPDPAPIMEYPLNEALSGPGMFYTRYHGKPVVFGYGTYLPLLYRERHPDLLAFPGDSALDQLASWGVRYILVTHDHLDQEPFTLADIDAQPRLFRVRTLDNVSVYELSETVTSALAEAP